MDVVDYFAEKMSEAPAASFPRSFGASLVWFEERSGLPENQKLSNDDVVKRYLENAMVEAAADSGQGTAVSFMGDRGSGADVSPPGETTSVVDGGLGTSGVGC